MEYDRLKLPKIPYRNSSLYSLEPERIIKQIYFENFS